MRPYSHVQFAGDPFERHGRLLPQSPLHRGAFSFPRQLLEATRRTPTRSKSNDAPTLPRSPVLSAAVTVAYFFLPTFPGSHSTKSSAPTRPPFRIASPPLRFPSAG